MTTLHLKRDRDPAPVAVKITWNGDHTSCVVEIDDRRFDADVTWTDGHAGHIRLAGRVVPFAVHRDGDVIEVARAGRYETVRLERRTARRAADAAMGAAANTLKAPMPGKILEIRCPAGEAFDAHDAIIVMESMKMEMTLSVPSAVRVREVLCAEGELVEMGELLAHLEIEAEPAA